MDSKIKLLDCTLRDGAYIVDSYFGVPAIRGIIDKLQMAEVDIIECGWLKDIEHVEGSSFFHLPNDLLPYLGKKKKDVLYTAMIDWNRYNTDILPINDGNSIDAIRVVFPHESYKEGIKIGENIKSKGYRIFYQAANTLAYSDEELRELALMINEVGPDSVSIVDTFGAMFEEDLERVAKVLNESLNSEIQLGFHSHNNQQLSFALTMHFIKILADSEREIVVDASLCGMGRGAGNATTELVAGYLNRCCNKHYDMDAIMDAIDVFMRPFQEKYKWGYSTPYYIAGMYCCHVNNVAYLLNTHQTSAKDMRNIIESLPIEDRRKYDYDLLESKYVENQNKYINDSDVRERFSSELMGHNIVLIAPGKSSLDKQTKIKEIIEEKNAIVIGVNAIVQGYNYDYLFFVNSGRYDYAKNVSLKMDKNTKVILLSNIKSISKDNEYIFAYSNAIKRGWDHFDNAVICALRLMDYVGVEKVYIAGFDGFKNSYNESYADPLLPTINPGKKWAELNDEIKSMFLDYVKNAKTCRQIEFITESIFNIS